MTTREPESEFNLSLLSTALILLDEHCKIVDLNPAAEQLLGFSSRQLEQETFFELVQGDLTPSVLGAFREQEKSGFIEDVEMRVGTGVVRTNLMVTPCSIYSDDDILLELQTNAHLQNIRKDLQIQHQSRVSEHLIRNLAHEVKNPLGGIKGAAQLLERKLPEDFSNKYSQIIIREADRLGALVDRLLMPAKPEAAQLVNPHLALEQALEIVELQLTEKNLITRDYDPSLPEVDISQNQIQQVFLNLIKNSAESIQQVDEQGFKGRLTVRTRMVHQHTIGQSQFRQVIRFDIEDNGGGIGEELVNDIFFPTISGKQSSGLGLSIAQSLVQRHQGIIELDQRQSPTRFSVYLPV
ncbi:MAG: PAS domain-containing protein [Kangiellaceae bacterium]|nr:PAS domain-containing protein [Kangiellaceae bacterium]